MQFFDAVFKYMHEKLTLLFFVSWFSEFFPRFFFVMEKSFSTIQCEYESQNAEKITNNASLQTSSCRKNRIFPRLG